MDKNVKQITAPIAFFIFNRPDTTQVVFESIRSIKPKRLYVVADGPRNDKESLICEETRKITENIDWECEVIRNYSEKNMGCKDRLSSGITWVFSQTDRAIILEDDCLPDPSFYYYCDELLEKYKDNPEIMHISGDNFQAKNKEFVCNESYYFSKISHIWGWASWKRAWNKYDKNIASWPEMKAKNKLHEIFNDFAVEEKWTHTFDQYYAGKISSWDGQWTYTCLMNKGISINPRVNLIKNIGFSVNATHEKNTSSPWANMPTSPVEIPLVHPRNISINDNAEQFTLKNNFGINQTPAQKIRTFIKKNFPKIYNKIIKSLK